MASTRSATVADLPSKAEHLHMYTGEAQGNSAIQGPASRTRAGGGERRWTKSSGTRLVTCYPTKLGKSQQRPDRSEALQNVLGKA